MQIIKGDKPDPEPEEDTTIKDMMLTHHDIDRMLIREQITCEQYDKLIKEVDVHANN
jgi:hypothetical protein